MTKLDLTPDLAWLAAVHHPDMLIGGYSIPRPFVLPTGVLKPLSGNEEYVIDTDFTVACGMGADVTMKGRADGSQLIAAALPDFVYVWAARTFFVTHGLQLVETVSLAQLAARADLPPPVLTRCPRCRGNMREPGTDALIGDHATMAPHCAACGAPQIMDANNQPLTSTCVVCGGALNLSRGCVSQAACTKCGGNGRIADFSDGFETIHGVTVDRRALKLIVPHLRGDTVALCLAPEIDGLGFECHLRPYVEQGGKMTCGGDWRVVWHAVPASALA
jgi:hypothetical protein